jgi:hypothetical protein
MDFQSNKINQPFNPSPNYFQGLSNNIQNRVGIEVKNVVETKAPKIEFNKNQKPIQLTVEFGFPLIAEKNTAIDSSESQNVETFESNNITDQIIDSPNNLVKDDEFGQIHIEPIQLAANPNPYWHNFNSDDELEGLVLDSEGQEMSDITINGDAMFDIDQHFLRKEKPEMGVIEIAETINEVEAINPFVHELEINTTEIAPSVIENISSVVIEQEKPENDLFSVVNDAEIIKNDISLVVESTQEEETFFSFSFTPEIAEVTEITNEIESIEVSPIVSEIESIEVVSVVSEIESIEVAPILNEIESIEVVSVVSEIESIEVVSVVSEIESIELAPIVSEIESIEVAPIVSEIESIEVAPIVNEIESIEVAPILSEIESIEVAPIVSEIESIDVAPIVNEIELIEVAPIVSEVISDVSNEISDLTIELPSIIEKNQEIEYSFSDAELDNLHDQMSQQFEVTQPEQKVAKNNQSEISAITFVEFSTNEIVFDPEREYTDAELDLLHEQLSKEIEASKPRVSEPVNVAKNNVESKARVVVTDSHQEPILEAKTPIMEMIPWSSVFGIVASMMAVASAWFIWNSIQKPIAIDEFIDSKIAPMVSQVNAPVPADIVDKTLSLAPADFIANEILTEIENPSTAENNFNFVNLSEQSKISAVVLESNGLTTLDLEDNFFEDLGI